VGQTVTLAVTVLGSSAMFATRERAASGYLLEVGDSRVWLDAGAGTWQHLLGIMRYEDIDGIILTHRHPDHTTDFFQAFHARHYGETQPLPPIPLWAPAETIDCVQAFCPDIKESFELHAVSGGQSIDLNAAAVLFLNMEHPPETVGVRVETERFVLAYSADTGPDADFPSLAGGADLFLCESTFQDSDGPWSGHMRASQAGSVAAEVGVRRLVLTHLPPRRDVGVSLAEARRNAADVEVELAMDGQRLEFPR
jgi:ribonuclease BN (tRNA processing enzyme)